MNVFRLDPFLPFLLYSSVFDRVDPVNIRLHRRDTDHAEDAHPPDDDLSEYTHG